MTGLGVIEADPADKRFDALFAQGAHGCGIGRCLKEPDGRFIDGAIGRLGREHDGDQQLKRRREAQLGRGVRIVRP